MKSYITVTDQFCGAGGSSLGAVAGGAEVKLALNHWRLAIETHNTNFPTTDHDCTDISACDPRRYPSTDILITSPECVNHSLAKGVKRTSRQLNMLDNSPPDPAAERSRATMWDVPRFAEYHNYRAIIVENVSDARHWVLWDAWVHAMTLLGYDHRVVYFNSMFAHPTPQSRDRLYVVFWKRGNHAPDLDYHPPAHCPQCNQRVASVQSWKNPNKRWGKYKQQYVYCCPQCATVVQPYYYAALNAIDWTIPAPRIGDRKRPLKEKTLARIRYGLEKFAGQALQLNVTQGLHGSRPLTDPTFTQVGTEKFGLVDPLLIKLGHATNPPSGYVRSADAPFPTQTTSEDVGLCVPPFFAQLRNNKTARPVTDELSTVCASALHHGLVIPPFLTSYYATDQGHRVDAALPTVTTRDRHALVYPPFLASYYGGRNAVQTLDAALPTVPGMAVHYLTQPGEIPDVDACGFRMLQPHEIAAAMAFPSDYVVLGTQREKIRQLGNAVTAPVMTWLMERVLATLGGA